MEEHETRIVSDFCHQLERSKQLFNGLRDLPQYGHKQWQSYFGKTFDIYTKLWKFQQQHRMVLDHRYGLRRWQIGEIASRIGQLYYHYYLRTSNTSYLHEAFAFYAAIRGRAYYTLRPGKADSERPELLVKKLRYYARFIVVCLLLKRLKLVRELVAEFGALVDEHGEAASGLPSAPGGAPDPRHEERHEWPKVLQEIGAFLEAESVVTVQDIDSNQVVLSHRLEPSSPFSGGGVDDTAVVGASAPGGAPLSLQEIIIVGNCSGQVKFSELTVDMYRMLQTLEREQTDTPASAGVPGATSCHTPPGAPSPHHQHPQNGAGPGRRDNPHKYLLYRPTFCQLMAFLASGFKELPAGGILLLYLSADGSFSTPSSLANGSFSGDEMYELGGVATDGRHREMDAHQPSLLLDTGDDSWQKQQQQQQQRHPSGEPGRNPNCFYPGDLLPFTRKPLLLIVDSDNASVFRCLVPAEGSASAGFCQPLVVLMSSRLVPPALSSRGPSAASGGRLLTLFLHSPLLAICHVCNLASISVHTWEQCRRLLDSLLAHTARALSACRALPAAFVRLMRDEFVRALLLRFAVCRLVLQQHRAFGGAGGAEFVPQSAPLLPDAQLMACAPLMRCLRELFSQLDARHLLVTERTDKEGATSDII